MRKFFISDIHGDYLGLMRLFRKAQVQPGIDQLVFGGDYINRGTDSGEVLRFIKRLKDQFPKTTVVLKGNHEEMIENYRSGKSRMWLAFGGHDVMEELSHLYPNEKELDGLLDWVENLPLYYMDEEFFYVHAGISPFMALDELDSSATLWMEKEELDGYAYTQLLQATGGRLIVHGHTPSDEVEFDGVKIGADLGSNTLEEESKRALALVDLTNGDYYRFQQMSEKIAKKKIGNWQMRKK